MLARFTLWFRSIEWFNVLGAIALALAVVIGFVAIYAVQFGALAIVLAIVGLGLVALGLRS